MATLSYQSGTLQNGYVRVGHNSSTTNPDAVWSIPRPSETGATKVKKFNFSISWNNTAAGSGWSGSYNYRYQIYNFNGALLLSGSVNISGSSGTLNVSLSNTTEYALMESGLTFHLNQNGSTYKTLKMFSQTGTVTFEFEKPTYTVSYNANGGSGAPSAQTKAHGVNLTLSSTKPTRTGYTFKGWGTSASATTVSYSAGGTYSANASATLYAIWAVNQYSVTREDRAENSSGALLGSDSVKANYGSTYKGSTKGSDTTVGKYYAGYKYSSSTSITVATANNKVYRYFTPASYTVTFDADGGTASAITKSVVYTKAYGILPAATRRGYNFLGWYDGNTLITSTSVFSSTSNKTLKAKWERTVVYGDIAIEIGEKYKAGKPYIYVNGKYKPAIAYVKDGTYKQTFFDLGE